MTWWAWMILAAVLLGAELFAVDAQFYLVFLGVSAVTVGGIDLLWSGSPMWAEWLLFSAVSVASLILFRSRLHSTLRVGAADSTQGLIGEIGTVQADDPSLDCRLRLEPRLMASALGPACLSLA